jgi:hypothetical protein
LRNVDDDQRHHAVQVVFVEVPVAGSPEPFPRRPPPAYPSNQRAPWRPQQSIPTSRKGEAVKRLLDAINRQDGEVRAFMAEARRRSA